MLAVLAAVALLVTASVVLGRALGGLLGREPSGAEPVLGLAAVVCVSATVVPVTGSGLLGGLVLLVLALAATAWLIRRGEMRRPATGPLLTGVGAALVACVPFAAKGRVGLLGVSLNNDTSVHTVWARTLTDDRMAALYGEPIGYPIGPHALVEALRGVLGGQPADGFTALMIATAVVCALAAWSLLDTLPALARGAAAVLVPGTYLVAAYHGQGAFKETLFAALLVGVAAHLDRLGPRPGWRGGVPLGLLLAAGLQAYSYTAAAWVVAGAGGFALAALLTGRLALRPALGAVAGAAGATLVAVATEGPRIYRYFAAIGVSPAESGGLAASDLGNLVGPLSPYQALPVWLSADFRFAAPNGFHAGEVGAIALLAVALGGVRLLRRRRLAIPAMALGALAIAWASVRSGQSPYVSAKALVMLAPFCALLAAWGLGARPEGGWRAELGLPQAVLGVVLLALAANASLGALRFSPVQARAHGDELREHARTVGEDPLLFLGHDDHAPGPLAGTGLATPIVTDLATPLDIGARREKPFTYGQPLDADSIAPRDLDRVDWVIVPRTGFDSSLPPNFERVRGGHLYELWRRTGPTPPTAVVEPPGSAVPGALLSCPRGRAPAGTAVVWAAPPIVRRGIPLLGPGASTTVPLTLPRGGWVLSLEYTSALEVEVEVAGRRVTMPAYTGRPGPSFEIDTIVADGGPVDVVLRSRRATPLTFPSDVTGLGAVIATRAAPPVRMPAAQACGRYVDRLEGVSTVTRR